MERVAVCALLLLEATLVNACTTLKFTEAGQCCTSCPAGYEVQVECGKEDTKCSPCPKGTFSDSEGLGRCLPCSKCPLGVPTLMSCSASFNTVCDCDDGFYYMGRQNLCAPCSKCRNGTGVVQECGIRGDTVCQTCGPGTFSEEDWTEKPCKTCTRCSNSQVEIRSCDPSKDTICMDRRLQILPRPTGSEDGPGRHDEKEEETSSTLGTLTPEEEGGSNNILAYVSVLAAVVLGLLLYVAYKCWRSCKQKQALSKARAAELGTSPEGEKLQSDSGVFLDSCSLQDNQPSKGTKTNGKLDNRLYINLPPHRKEEVERLLQEGGGRGWRHLGLALGYESEQLDPFGHGEAPAHTLLSDWAQKEGSSLGLLSSALARIERPDVVAALTCPSQGVSVV
ncbi:tumor necrosis factor receptor superfamily member 16 [Oryzias melastigma]|uniref:Neurotrophin receptor associated death domain n=1 Tax=Oryzias melastigma TaxID=30732 RepID=A0A3B3CTD3_ORYME|nr:tumor necrosis factor receptor superfamily member 16 [Oryzias melastigma]